MHTFMCVLLEKSHNISVSKTRRSPESRLVTCFVDGVHAFMCEKTGLAHERVHNFEDGLYVANWVVERDHDKLDYG